MKCNECTEGLEASFECVECGLLLCDECHRHHRKSKRSSSHSTIPLPSACNVPTQQIPDAPSPQVIKPRMAHKLSGPRPKEVIDIDMLTEHLHGGKMDDKKYIFPWNLKLIRQNVPNWKPSNVEGKQDKLGKKAPGWLGIEFENRVDGQMVITNVVQGGPADERPDIRKGDLLVAIADRKVRKLPPSDLAGLTKGEVGSTLEMQVGAEYLPGAGFSTEHLLASGKTVKVERAMASEWTASEDNGKDQSTILLGSPAIEISTSSIARCSLDEQESINISNSPQEDSRNSRASSVVSNSSRS